MNEEVRGSWRSVLRVVLGLVAGAAIAGGTFGFHAQNKPAGWKLYSFTNLVSDDVELFYASDDIKRLPTGRLQV